MTQQQTGGWDELATLGTRRRYRRGDTLFLEGDRSDCVMAVLEGRVKISVLTPSGREIVLGTKEPGELVGELAAVDGRRRSATATALDDVAVTVLSMAAFEALLDAEPAAPANCSTCSPPSCAPRTCSVPSATRDRPCSASPAASPRWRAASPSTTNRARRSSCS